MKKTVEFNSKFNLGDVVYGIEHNVTVKAKIICINYSKQDTLVKENTINCASYDATPLDNSLNKYYIRDDSKNWFKTKDELIDYLKTQIDRVTTDDYTIDYEAQ